MLINDHVGWVLGNIRELGLTPSVTDNGSQMIDILGTLSASAAAGMRIAVPILVIGLLRADKLWSDIPLLERIDPKVLIFVLSSWSTFELFGSKKLIGQRLLQTIQLILSPLVGALMAISVAKISNFGFQPIWLIALIGALLAVVVKLVEIGWFFRLRGLPIWVVLIEDLLSICLVFFAFHAPQQGGIIAMLLLWLAIRSSNYWRQWYFKNKKRSKER